MNVKNIIFCFQLVTCADDMKLRIFRRKNIDVDDFDETLKIHGISERYIGRNEKERLINREESPKTRERRSSGCIGTFPLLPVTPSTSGIRRPCNFTPSGGAGNSTTPQTCPKTPQSYQGIRGRVTPSTPKTSERNTLLHWLINAKTPRSVDSSSTEEDSDSKKNTHKRKLTDLMDEDQENLPDKEKVKSPIKDRNNILCPSFMNSQTPQAGGVAKMLKYGDDSEAALSTKGRDESSVDMGDSVKPIDATDKLMTGFRTPVTNVSFKVMEKSVATGESVAQETQTDQQNTQNCNVNHFGKFSSPTADLPNYIIDGTSPHSRPESRIEKKRHTNWLTSMSHQRKLKFIETPDKVVKNAASSKAFSSYKKPVKKTLRIKPK